MSERFKTYILPYLKKYKWFILATVILGTLTLFVSSMLTFTSGYLITRASERPETILLLYVPIVGVRAFGISRAVTKYLERLFGHSSVLRILSTMRVKLYNLLEPQALFIRSRFQTGDLLGTLADDIEHLQDAYIRTIFPTVSGLCIFLFSVITFSIFDWKFGIFIGLCMGIVVFAYPLFSLYFLKKRQQQLKEKRKHLYQSWTDALFGISDWMISGRTKTFTKSFMEHSRQSNEINRKMANWNYARAFQLNVITAIILIFVGLWSATAAQNGEIMPTYIAAFTLAMFPVMEGMTPISIAVEKIPTYEESLQRIDRIKEFAKEHPVRESKQVTFPKKPDIEIQNIYYRYQEGQEEAIKNISIHIPYGSKVAILGKSGAGKSTLLHLLLGVIEPSKGNIRIGGINPAEVTDQIFDYIGVLNQKPYLFNTTVRNNIRLGKSDATDEEVREAIRQVKLDDYIMSLPKGIHTQMQETGQRFSGGERQRIALARILLKNPPIVVLDEPTVGLDPKTELDLLETMFSSLEGKTVIMITHHLIGLEQMDQIIFLDQGEVAMMGTHEELMENNSRYRELYLMDRGEI